MVKIIFFKLDFFADFPEGLNQLPGCLVEDIVIPSLGEKINGNVVGQLFKYRFQLVLNRLVQDCFWLVWHVSCCFKKKSFYDSVDFKI